MSEGWDEDVTVPKLFVTTSEKTYLRARPEGFPPPGFFTTMPRDLAPDEHGIDVGNPASAGSTLNVQVAAFATVAFSENCPPSGDNLVTELVKLVIDGGGDAAVAAPRERTRAPTATTRRVSDRIGVCDIPTALTSRTPRSSGRPPPEG